MFIITYQTLENNETKRQFINITIKHMSGSFDSLYHNPQSYGYNKPRKRGLNQLHIIYIIGFRSEQRRVEGKIFI